MNQILILLLQKELISNKQTRRKQGENDLSLLTRMLSAFSYPSL